jgi:hypothetical protein
VNKPTSPDPLNRTLSELSAFSCPKPEIYLEHVANSQCERFINSYLTIPDIFGGVRQFTNRVCKTKEKKKKKKKKKGT